MIVLLSDQPFPASCVVFWQLLFLLYMPLYLCLWKAYSLQKGSDGRVVSTSDFGSQVHEFESA